MRERCEQQAELVLRAVSAMNRVYDAKNELERARKRKLETKRLEDALHDAQAEEHFAVAALDSHKKQHQCWGIGLPKKPIV